MALEIEDGTGKETSQSYVGAAEARDFALVRGISLPAAPGGSEPDPVEAMLVKDFESCRQVGLSEVKTRPWPLYLATQTARLLSPVL